MNTAYNCASSCSDQLFDDAELDLLQNAQESTVSTKPVAPKNRKLVVSPRIKNMLDECAAIQIDDAKESGTLGFLNSMLVQATLPHSNPGNDVIAYERSSGVFKLTISSRKSVGLPYGSLPRSLLAWICTEAVKTKSKTLYLGSSQAEFLRDGLNMASTGMYISRVKDQAFRLFNSTINVENKQDSRTTVENTVIARRASFWTPQDKDDKPNAWQSELTLSADFYEDITSSPVPTDLRILNALRKSPLAMDIYTWLCYRQFVMSIKGDSVIRIPWAALRFQFGANYNMENKDDAKALHNFRYNFLMRLKEVAIFHPDLLTATHSSTSKLFVLRQAKSMLKLKQPL